MMKFVSLRLVALGSVVPTLLAFTSVAPLYTRKSSGTFGVFPLGVSSQTTESSTDSETEDDPLGLTPELARITNAFELVADDKLRHKQLLYMANQLAPLKDPAAVMIPENKVPGCLSTVYIDGTATYDESQDAYTIDFIGDSDGLLTKGLVALLVRGLSGNSAEDIQKVNPEFIQKAGIAASLTPGRNNGFLNMLAVMKQKALDLEESAKTGGGEPGADALAETVDDRPMYNGMMEALQKLQPTSLSLIDNSHQHAGHEGAKGYNGESHFELDIVAPAFEGLSLVKRHQLIYMLLGDIMDKIHALQITRAKTPDEV